MPDITILNETELRRLVPLDLAIIDEIEKGFFVMAEGSVVMPPILSMAIEEFNGEIDVKTAYVPGFASFAVKMSPGFFDNPKLGLPSTSGLMVLFAAQTGQLEALLLDNGYLTDIRTAAAGAVAARHLSRKDAERVCVIGAGAQARLQLKALCLVREIKQVDLWARDLNKAKARAAELSQELGLAINVNQDRETAVRASDIIVTTTPSTTSLIEADWLQAGQHITAMGSDQHHKRELAAACLTRADCYVPDRQSQTALLGELHHAINEGLVANDTSFAELGAIISRKAQGRVTDQDITIADLTGTGLQDTVIATLAWQRALEQDAGTFFRS